MNDRGVVLAQARMAILVALRTPRVLIFTAAFPLILLVLFNSIFSKGGNETTTLPGDLKLSAEAYFTAGIIAYSVALSTFTTLAVSLTTQRENGQLKRYRGTPMPPWTFIAAQITRASAQALLMTALLLGVGAVAYGVPVPASTFPAFIVYVLLGTATMCSLGIALSAFTPNPDAASTIAPFSVVMLSFVSGVWIPVDQLPSWLETVGKVFPLYHLALGLQTTLAPGASGTGLELGNVIVLLVWCAVGIRIASKRFKWEPQAAKA
ncbi:MAG TPA: ABC transporter permease [Solirubrobacterales bacterium]|nr:ABC transporter permease [Solirubrobacterales bacterium]